MLVQGPLSFLQSDIEKLERRFIELTMTSNAAELAKLLMPTFSCVNHYGSLLSREEFLNQFQSGSTQVAMAEEHSFKVEFLSGEIALVRGLIKVNMRYPNWVFKGLTIYSRVWQKREGTFKAVFLHVSDAQIASDWNKLLKK